MRNFEQEVSFGHYLQVVNEALKRFADYLAEDISVRAATLGGEAPEVTLTAYWESLCSLGTWKDLRDTAVTHFMESVSGKCPPAWKYLARKIAVSHLEYRNE
jgi:hypothetical protein